MIRYAAHRVFILSGHQLLSGQVVELDQHGAVTGVAPFTGEVHHTIWMDGILLISSVPPVPPVPGESFDSYISRLQEGPEGESKKKRAYQITNFDIPAMRFRANSLVKPLC